MTTAAISNQPSANQPSQAHRLFEDLRQSFSIKSAWFGPAFIASVAYVDPGNFAANIAGGAQCGYNLLWILLWGNVIAILVQTLACRLGIFTGASLAKNCGIHMPSAIKLPLWIVSELMSVATDLAEVLGAGIGITLIFHTALFPSCVIAGLVSFLPFLKQQREQKFLEKLMGIAVFCIGCAFCYELYVTKPDWFAASKGALIPQLNKSNVLIAASMLGATVMPHVVFLHSALMNASPSRNEPDKRYRYAIADNFTALNFAWLINTAMVITFAVAFAGKANIPATIESANQLLIPTFGELSSLAFGAALILSGLSSTTVGAMAGQIILDGFFDIKIPLWCRRALTLTPCILIIHTGIDSTHLLVLSQAILCIALPFTIVPLIWLNASQKVMKDRQLKGPMLLASWIAAGMVIALNIILLANMISDAAKFLKLIDIRL